MNIDMKKFIIPLLLICGLNTAASAQLKLGDKNIDISRLINAAGYAAKAIALSDADIVKMCQEHIEWMDAQNPLAKPDSEYAKRLEKLTGHIQEIEGVKVNFGVYEVEEVNAFASGDGSIRVYAGLMDIMTDDEIMAVIGHEMGHVVHTDTKDAMKNAYLLSAAKSAAGVLNGSAMARLTDSQLGAIAQALATARFSQKQETEADDFAFEFCVKNDIDPYAMSNALNKLVEMYEAGGEKTSLIQQMFSTHPDSAKRAARMKEKADQYTGNGK